MTGLSNQEGCISAAHQIGLPLLFNRMHVVLLNSPCFHPAHHLGRAAKVVGSKDGSGQPWVRHEKRGRVNAQASSLLAHLQQCKEQPHGAPNSSSWRHRYLIVRVEIQQSGATRCKTITAPLTIP